MINTVPDQISLFRDFAKTIATPASIDLDSYDYIIACTPGGKGSIGRILHLIDLGDPKRIELWHHHH